MHKLSQTTWAYTKTKEDLKDQFGAPDWTIKDFKVDGFANTSNTRKAFTIELTFKDGRIERHTALAFCESAPYTPAPFGTWGINPVSVLKNFGTIKAKPKKNESGKQ